jgi:4-hydroxy-2-oxoheptanedioate aldolase
VNNIKKAISEGRPSLGVWSTSGSPVLAELAGRAGLDWVLLDTQHGAVGEAELLPCVQAVGLGGTPALVRVGSGDPRLIMRALDFGAAGVVVPLVSTPEQAAAAVAATRYPPVGSRSFGPVRRYYDAGGAAEAEPLCLAMIETAAGLESVDAIAATPGLDGVFIGPVDLGLDLGLGMADFADLSASGSAGRGTLREPIEAIVAATRRHGIIAGAAALSPPMVEQMLEAGIQLTTIGGDMTHVRQGYAADASRRAELISKYSRGSDSR